MVLVAALSASGDAQQQAAASGASSRRRGRRSGSRPTTCAWMSIRRSRAQPVARPDEGRLRGARRRGRPEDRPVRVHPDPRQRARGAEARAADGRRVARDGRRIRARACSSSSSTRITRASAGRTGCASALVTLLDAHPRARRPGRRDDAGDVGEGRDARAAHRGHRGDALEVLELGAARSADVARPRGSQATCSATRTMSPAWRASAGDPRTMEQNETVTGVAQEMIERRREKLTLDALDDLVASLRGDSRGAQGGHHRQRRMAALPPEPRAGEHGQRSSADPAWHRRRAHRPADERRRERDGRATCARSARWTA